MRSVPALALIALLCVATPAAAARGVASAPIVVPVAVVAASVDGSAEVWITTVREGANEHVTIAFN